MITAQILGKTELTGVFKELLEAEILNGGLSDNLTEDEKEILISGFAANICYTEKDMEEIVSRGSGDKSAIKLAIERANNCFKSGHHSVDDHKRYAVYFTGLPKLLAMVLNNEKDYATSEKSARYTKMKVTPAEEEIYYKWIKILKTKILIEYPTMDATKAEKLAQENARYMISVFTPTKMLYSVSHRQLNYLIKWLDDSLEQTHPLYIKLRPYTAELLTALRALPIEQIDLQQNEKNRSLSLIKNNNYMPAQFGEYYATNYKGTFAQLAQAHRHRTLDYSLSLPGNFESYIPKIIRNDAMLVGEWQKDITSLANNYPQGMLINISEGGKIEDFILKTKERLCGYAQLEICDQTKATLNSLIKGMLKKKVESTNINDMEFYQKMYDRLQSINKGARCTQPDYKCPKPCGNIEAITLERRI